MNILITGGAGFIGSAVVRRLLRDGAANVLVVDALTYAGNLESLKPVANAPGFTFVKADICDAASMRAAFCLSVVNVQRVRRLPLWSNHEAYHGSRPSRL